VYDDEVITLSLTGPDSHTFVRESGVGNISIGPAVAGRPEPTIVVGVDDPIDWSAFDPLRTPSGDPWPRWIYYHGNDTGFVAWSGRRRIESFDWAPAGPAVLDANAAGIRGLGLTLRGGAHLEIVLPARCSVTVSGDLSLLHPTLAGEHCPHLRFAPATRPGRDSEPLPLPAFPALAAAGSVDVQNEPMRQAVDCTSLAQFPGVRALSLFGAVTGLAELARLTGLTSLELRYCPDLSALPPLSTWPGLTRVLAWNVEEATGRRLRTEVRGRGYAFASVTQLRTPQWFTTEYGLPFSGWPRSTARKATRGYRAAAAAIGQAATEQEVATAVRGFVKAVNALPGIETTEREDAAAAVVQLAGGAPVDVPAKSALAWFDAERDF